MTESAHLPGWDPNWRKRWDAESYQGSAGDVYGLAGPLFAKLKAIPPREGMRVLDIGAGEGRITKLLLESNEFKPYKFEVVAVDFSEEMVAKAVQRGLDARRMDAANLTFGDKEFDLVFSLSALHWVEDAEAVVRGVSRVLKPGGHFIAEFARHSPPTVRNAIYAVMAERYGVARDDVEKFDPWRKTKAEEYRGFLVKHGLGGDSLELHPIERHVNIPWGMKNWLKAFIADSFLSPLTVESDPEKTAARKDEAMDLIVDRLRSTHLYDEAHDRWYVDYNRLSVCARKARFIDMAKASVGFAMDL